MRRANRRQLLGVGAAAAAAAPMASPIWALASADGSGYRPPGTPHRTGHGIGLDGHEPVNLVDGETTPLAFGVGFSNELGIYIPGQFGVGIEDCFHITPDGPRFFTQPPNSLEQPFG